MAASKFIMSIRSFLFQTFGDDQLIHIIAMATPEDMKASAKHLALANAYYEVPGGPNFNNCAQPRATRGRSTARSRSASEAAVPCAATRRAAAWRLEAAHARAPRAPGASRARARARAPSRLPGSHLGGGGA